MEEGHQIAGELGSQVQDHSNSPLMPERTMEQAISIDTEDLDSDTSSMYTGEIRCYRTRVDNSRDARRSDVSRIKTR